MGTAVARTPLLVALIGFMGAGKSTVGRVLAGLLGVPFVDLDDAIVASAGISIAEIFRSRGESAFRAMESAHLRAVGLAANPLVLAAGGGAPLRPENHAFFAERARTFYLAAPFDELRARTAGETGRPLRSDSPRELLELYESRLSVYEGLGERVDTGARSPEDVAREILRRLGPDARDSPG